MPQFQSLRRGSRRSTEIVLGYIFPQRSFLAARDLRKKHRFQIKKNSLGGKCYKRITPNSPPLKLSPTPTVEAPQKASCRPPAAARSL